MSLLFSIRVADGNLFWKELFIRITVRVFRERLSIQSNFNALNNFGTMKICSRQG